MEQHVPLRPRLGKRAPVDLHDVPQRIGVGPGLDHDRAVHANPTRRDQSLGGAP
jgi:hypothetical protein